MSKGLKLSEILVTVLIAVIFAIIYNLWWFPYEFAKVAGLHLEQLTYGVWFMAAIVAYLIIPKPGIAIIAEFAAGAGETIVMGKFDIPTIIYAILQGVACEIIFAIFKYQSRSAVVAMLAGLLTALISFPVDYFYGYLNEVAGWNLLLFIVFRAISGIILAGLLSYIVVKALDQTGVTKLFRPASKQDYDNL
ncbi:ECF transporter S component [Staphylococcus lugdunensis]|jgi:energy-coupling factor transport system substrate-specific component|uniref:Thiamine ABC transporter permease n=2 Tax=Staphylococcus TaxID=1279 RepID=A0A292DFM2_STALU|nr:MULTISPECIES: ECF transporter S component [Staphylococcus]ADC87887.1 Substrate-specific component YkoE of thiamin-regulated ECF transporter for HydroxyMethylPyrimidine [Staphylococcus lugdunensis HKU09-01]AMG61003.1 thiamine ABC transporter permease [Staphylococcus lugdunensis]AMG62817.1 thiamine ABC transporter permease [Staphylococcus lugdunensis]ARB78111.1 thiamine ABC transporter permease [Staphylococcus lugdunensis]ARJ09634.1 thiamine ABC transporter permease [Staphylococcus lugdunensi